MRKPVSLFRSPSVEATGIAQLGGAPARMVAGLINRDRYGRPGTDVTDNTGGGILQSLPHMRPIGGATISSLTAAMVLAAFTSVSSAQAPRLGVDLGCQPTQDSLAFLCTMEVTDPSGKPIDGAEISLTADMPSMPMVHNVKPAKAVPMSGQPGKYQAQLTLGMLGEWVVKLRFVAPQSDVVVRKLNFQKDKVSAGGAH